MTLGGTIATNGSNWATVGWLIDNEGTAFNVFGGTFLAPGGSTLNNPSGAKGNWDSVTASTLINNANMHVTYDTGLIIYPTGTVPVAGSATINQAACIKSAGPPTVIGYCSTVVGSGGGCTCN